MQANQLWTHWQALLQPYAEAFSYWGFHRFTEWVTGLALNVEEHTVTQSLVGLDRPQDWKALETFVEYGAWDQAALERATAALLDQAPGRLWYGYRVWAGDDTKVHRSSAKVWGTCTFHEYTARCPNRAGTVRAHNWVVVGALLPRPDQPACFLPHTGRLYCRQSQLPAGVPFQTKCVLLVEQLRAEAAAVDGEHLAVVDGGFALRSVVRPLVRPAPGHVRIEFLTRLRGDACLYRLPDAAEGPRRGPKRKWGPRLAPPRQGGRWPGKWQEGRAFIYGRWRKVRWKEAVCLWKVSGADVKVKAVVAEVEGYRKRFTLVSSRPGVKRLAPGGIVLCALPARRWFPGSQAAVGLGRVPGLDAAANLAHHLGRAADVDVAAVAAVSAGGGGGQRLVAATAVEPAQDAAERARPGASAAAAPGGNSGVSGPGTGKCRQKRAKRDRGRHQDISSGAYEGAAPRFSWWGAGIRTLATMVVADKLCAGCARP